MNETGIMRSEYNLFHLTDTSYAKVLKTGTGIRDFFREFNKAIRREH
jgi:hypothetical protein